MTTYQDAERLMDMVFGFIPAQVVHVLATLDIADHLVDQPASGAELAKLTASHEPSLRRLLRGAVHLGLLTLDAEGRYELTPAGQPLRGDVQFSIKHLAKEMGGEPTWSACGKLDQTVRTGRSGVQYAFGESGYDWLTKNPDEQADLYTWVVESARRDVPAVVAGLDLSGARTMVDVGGGNGILTAGLLVANPELTGTIFDLAAAQEYTGSLLAESGVAQRCALVVGNFLTDPLPPGQDVYLAKGIVSDWADDDALRILRGCAEAMRADSELVLIDLVMPADDAATDSLALMSDLCTLACGGEVRTEAHLRSLLDDAGLRLVEVGGSQVEGGTSLIRAVRS
ncbi:MAG TPA: methyltransferase [Pseudonocardiaceae bacterium]|jgi:hypothetical protein|nr:methyltransferase [Pseudonocardiaceae bacterium]